MDGDDWFNGNGFTGIIETLPSAMWFFLAIEELPLAAPEGDYSAVKPAMKMAFGTLVVLAIGTLTLTSALKPLHVEGSGATLIAANAEEPLFYAFDAIFGNVSAKWLSLLGLVGMVTSFNSIVLAAGELVCEVSMPRNLYLFDMLARRREANGAPYVALMFSSSASFAVFAVLKIIGKDAMATAINMTILTATLQYMVTLTAFLVTSASELGLTIAASASIVMCALVAASVFINAEYRDSGYAVIACLIALTTIHVAKKRYYGDAATSTGQAAPNESELRRSVDKLIVPRL